MREFHHFEHFNQPLFTMQFLQELKFRNEGLYYFGLVCLIASLAFLVLSKFSNTKVFNVSAYYKPFKFAFSTFLFSWAMAWYCFYLPNFNTTLFNLSTIILLSFEIIYIAIQAGRGQLSHYNNSTPTYALLYSMMALAATLVTLYTAYVAFLFCTTAFPALPNYYVWAIRLSLFIFVIFSFEGFAMGSRMNHSVGALNDNSNLFILGWSKTVGDLRIAHFIGMHALQVLPVLAFYFLKNTKATFAVAILYFLLAAFTLFQALKGRPFFKSNPVKTVQE
jgi:hypothetical protein